MKRMETRLLQGFALVAVFAFTAAVMLALGSASVAWVAWAAWVVVMLVVVVLKELKELEDLSPEGRREVLARYSPKTRLPGWPRFWKLCGFCFSKKIQDEVYEPGRNELLEDYLLARKYRTKWARRWLTFCFIFRTALLFADCWRVLLKDGAVKIILGFIPWPLK